MGTELGGGNMLKHLKDLLTKTYSESHYLADGSMVTEGRQHLNHCCYTGFVEGAKDSSVSLCTCQGLSSDYTSKVIHWLYQLNDLSGYISIGDKGYAVDPVEDSSQKCKVSRLEHVRTKRHLTLPPAKLMAHPKLPFPPWNGIPATGKTRNTNLSIELFLVADREEKENELRDMFLRNDGDLRKTKERLITLAHHVNQIYYKELNIQIFLIGIEIWTTENKVSSSQDTSEALLKFMKWRSEELVPRKHHDNAQLISGVPYQTSLGQAYLNEMCSKERSGGVVKDTWASTREVAKYIAHEIGHNLGMHHDEPTCHCPVKSGKCLLAKSAVWMINPMFSNCSKAFLERFLNEHDISCLMDQPDTSMPQLLTDHSCGQKLPCEGALKDRDGNLCVEPEEMGEVLNESAS
ncbi:disintegrin and metalloproteinase domain-containing protein 12-like [Heterodontus francisci]|uniref:disintegrin and metalloproteinase domain-containing protein 12-like n=1 Tax=Heterodontus francisci TaxID=7792 RepID=UPI00355BBB7D